VCCCEHGSWPRGGPPAESRPGPRHAGPHHPRRHAAALDGPAGHRPARGGRRLRLALDPRPSHPPVGGADARGVGVLVAPVGHRRRHQARRTRDDRPLHQLPQPGAAGEDGRHPRRDQRRAADPGAGGGVARAGVHRLRLPVRPPRQPLRGGLHHHPHAPAGGADRRRGPLLPGARVRAAATRPAPARAAPPGRHARRADAAPDGARGGPVERLAGDAGQRSRARSAAPRGARHRLRGDRSRSGDAGADGRGARRPGGRRHDLAPTGGDRGDTGRDRERTARLRAGGDFAPPGHADAEHAGGGGGVRAGAGAPRPGL
ncbi:MAG: hypothetical protein AVDCRST_MAG88-3476, partial [uncultured Thermomicrobiales bacterium]